MHTVRLIFSSMRGRSFGGYHRNSHSSRRAVQFPPNPSNGQNQSNTNDNIVNNNSGFNNSSGGNNDRNNNNSYNNNGNKSRQQSQPPTNYDHGRAHQSRRSRRHPQHQAQPASQAPAYNPLDQYTYDFVSPEEVMTLDIFPQIVDDLLSPGKAICYLTQVITVAENHNRNLGGIRFETQMIESQSGPVWVGFLTINYPQTRTFTCYHRNKKECKNICALAAVYHMRKNNNIDSKLKYNMDASLASRMIDSSRAPIMLSPLSMSIKQQMMSFIGKFDEYVANLLEYRIDTERNRFDRLVLGGVEGKHSTILEGLEPDDGIVAMDFDEKNEISTSNGPIDIFTNRPFSQPDVKKKNLAFAQLQRVFANKRKKFETDNQFYKIVQTQNNLPIQNLRQNIVEALYNHRAIVVAGDTGCGKSTQLPQMILEHFARDDLNLDKFTNIAITQPRRISAIALAERVALELGEPSSGYTVGHNVRFDTKQPCRDLNMMTFFTTGMLLRKLQRNPDLKGVTHLVIDEVHERDCTTDFLLILIKRLLARQKDIRVIFMSASMDASLFARYFDNCPIISIPGRCYPVNDVFLTNICQEMRIGIPRDEVKDLSRAPKLNLNLLVDLIRHIDESRGPGAILCFMPGWKEMKALQKELNSIRTKNRLKVLLAHSKLPISEQRLIFRRVEDFERKIIISTNIAETSLTINDVCYVIDTGLCNSIDYEPELNMSTFGTRWISKANAKQRSGRAGRTCAGECFKLYTKSEEANFQEYPFPELLRIPLESVIMEAKSHCPGEKAVTFLSQAIQHPSIMAIHSALEELMLLGVLDSKENLTVLGKRISEFPTHPRLSVSLIIASALRCLYPVLNASAILSSTQEPFLTALTDKSQIRATKERLCREAIGSNFEPLNYMSDHIAFANLLAQYDNSILSNHELNYFVEENNLNRSAMSNIQECRNLHAKMMVTSKFVNTYEWSSFDSLPNTNMNELELVVASMVYSFYPKIVRVIRGVLKGGRINLNKVSPIDIPSGNKIRYASDSIVRNISLGKQLSSLVRDDDSDGDSDYLSMPDVLDDRRPAFITYLNSRHDSESGQIVIRDGSVVPALTLLIFGGRDFQIYEQPSKNPDVNENDMVNVTLDQQNLLTFRLSRDDATVIGSWRKVWQAYFDWFVHTKNTSKAVDQNDNIIMGTMKDFLELNKKLYQSIRY